MFISTAVLFVGVRAWGADDVGAVLVSQTFQKQTAILHVPLTKCKTGLLLLRDPAPPKNLLRNFDHNLQAEDNR